MKAFWGNGASGVDWTMIKGFYEEADTDKAGVLNLKQWKGFCKATIAGYVHIP